MYLPFSSSEGAFFAQSLRACPWFNEGQYFLPRFDQSVPSSLDEVSLVDLGGHVDSSKSSSDRDVVSAQGGSRSALLASINEASLPSVFTIIQLPTIQLSIIRHSIIQLSIIQLSIIQLPIIQYSIIQLSLYSIISLTLVFEDLLFASSVIRKVSQKTFFFFLFRTSPYTQSHSRRS